MTEKTPVERAEELRKIDRKYLVFYLRIFDGMSNKILGYLVDISANGLQLIGDFPVEINENYRLRMRLPTMMKERHEILFNATSRWCKNDDNPDFYVSGFQMHDLKPQKTELIKNLIQDFGYNDPVTFRDKK
jgi:hypothetical protein